MIRYKIGDIFTCQDMILEITVGPDTNGYYTLTETKDSDYSGYSVCRTIEQIEEWMVPVVVEQKVNRKCECGAHLVRDSHHAQWCPMVGK